jgi:hypothetical protein
MTPILARLGDAKCGIAPVDLHGEHDAAQRDGWFPAMAPPSAREMSSWLERSPSMSWL